MTETTKLGWEDICRHEHRCEGGKMFYHTVPDYRTYSKAMTWLREEREYKFICTEAEGQVSYNGNMIYTGRYTFKFLCEQEYMWFKLRWS
jgi:hypothetical protein